MMSWSAFIRMGRDLTDNYYQIEVPLKYLGSYKQIPSVVWPEANEIDLPLSVLKELKGSQITSSGIDPTYKYVDVSEDGTLVAVAVVNLHFL